MVIVRPIQTGDLEPLEELARLTSFGLTTLPKDRKLLTQRVDESLHAFARLGDRPRGDACLFVMEDTATGKPVGTTGVWTKVGGFDPFYAYRLETSVHESDMLGVRKEIRTLHLVTEHNGPCEIGSLFLHPQYRGSGNGRLLSLSRFLFMAQFPESFDPCVIAEMRGVIDDRGRSAFWDAIGRHFFDIEYPKADHLSFVNKRFIADLMPRHPIYVPLLPADAQAVIGQVHEETRPALEILKTEGFAFSGMVDIFEAGPIMTCPLEQIRSVRASARLPVESISDEPVTGEPCVISNAKKEFRAAIGPVEVSDRGVRLQRVTALGLGVRVGEPVRFVTMRPAGNKNSHDGCIQPQTREARS